MNRGKGMASFGQGQSKYGALTRLRRSRGFTLIELMIVVAIIAVLASIAYPSYIKYITKTRRNAATACLSEYANYMERYYTTNLSYKQPSAAVPALGCADTTQTGDYYNYQFGGTPASPTSTAYSIQAVPQDVQASRDTQCGTLGLNQSGTRFIQSSESTAAPVAACWK